VVCCICCCALSDDGDLSSEIDSEDEFFEDEKLPNPDDVETQETFVEGSGEPSTEGLRQRIKEVRKED